MGPKPEIQSIKILGLVILPVLLLRLFVEKILYLSRFNSFIPGDLFLVVAVFFAQKALKNYVPENRIADRKSVRIAVSIIAVIIFGLGQGIITAASGKQSWGVFFLPSQLYHMTLSYVFGGYIVSQAFLPLFHIKWSRDKCLGIFFLGLYLLMLIVDSIFGDSSHDFAVDDWQNQRVLLELK